MRVRAATANKASKDRALPKCWVSICFYKKQPVKKIWTKSESWPVQFFVSVLHKQLTDFTSKIINNIQIERGLHLFQGLLLFLEKELDFSGVFIKIIFYKFWP